MKFEIKSRWDGSVLFSVEIDSLKLALELAVKQGANLGGANLMGAYLMGADLSGADLSGAYLRGADLSGADLSGANLMGANLSGANLMGAYLMGANLMGANLMGAYLRGADLSGADLSGANLMGANLSGAYLMGANLSGAYLMGAYLMGANLRDADFMGAKIPVIPHIDAAILAAVRREGHGLDMAKWHTCEMAHCRGGWAVTLAGEAGRKLEEAIGVKAASALIYQASRPTKRIPDFYASNEDAMNDIERCAAEDPLP